MSDIEDARRQELQKRIQQAQKQKNMEEELKKALRMFLEPPAYERMMNVKFSDPDLYTQTTILLARLQQGGKLQGKLNDAQLVQLLGKLTQKKEPTIEIKRK